MALVYRFDLTGDGRVESMSPPALPMPQQKSRHLILVLVTLAVTIGFGPATAFANASPHQSSTMPRAATAPRGPQREVFGFALASSLSDPTVGYPSWDFSLLTTVAFFGLHVNSGDGHFATDSGWNVFNSTALPALVSAAHSHGAKVVVTIVLQDFAAGTPQMCAGLTHTATTIADTVTEIKAKGLDGVNVDYEGLNGSCGTADSSWARHAFTSFVGGLRAATSGYYLTVDTYASSAADPYGFFDVKGLAPSTDAFFVMAYDLEYSNWVRPPTNCSRFCLGPTSPLGSYYYNDMSVTSQYTAAVPASKVILGVPYYGRKACVPNPNPHGYPTSGVVADTYLDASQESTAASVQPGSYTAHRDANDPAGQERWDTWINTSLNCVRELYWDDTISLGHKYALVNSAGLRGVGMWNLNYGGGAPELWSLLNTYFACPVTVTLPASVTTTQFSLGLSAGTCSVTGFDVQEFDSTLNQGWWSETATKPASGASSVVAEGYPGHTYQFRVRARSAAGIVSGWTTVSTSVATTATHSHPFSGLYVLDAYGGVNAADSPFLASSATWGTWNIARSAHFQPSPNAPQSGAVLDGYGGLHPYGAPITIKTSAYWAGWDIARDFAFLPDGSGGFVLDGWGGLHPFHVNGSTATLAAQGNAYWSGRDIARKVVIFADGKGGYTLDAWGGIHPFGINGPPPIAATAIAQTGYWSGWNIARDIVLVPGNGGHSGYTLDGWGGVHPFHVNGDGSTMPATIKTAYWSGWDIARGMLLLPGSTTAGYTLDGWGGLHAFGGAPSITSQSYWPGRDIAKCLWGA
jgi:spore germination protein YaaH